MRKSIEINDDILIFDDMLPSNSRDTTLSENQPNLKSKQSKSSQRSQRQEAFESSKKFLASIAQNKMFRTKIKNNIKKSQKIQRKQQSLIAFILTIFCTSLMGTQNLYLFLWNYPDRDKYLFFPTLVLRPILFIAFSYSLCRNLKVLTKLYFCFDRIFLAGLASTLSVVVYSYFFLPLTDSPWIYYSMFGLAPLLNLSFSGYCRVIVVFCKWQAWKTIIFKLSVILGGTAYFGLGIYYTIVDGEFTDGASPKLDNIILELLFLYAFAGFDFHIEIISMVDDADGTIKNKSNYKLELKEQDMQILLHGKKFNENNNEEMHNSNGRQMIPQQM